MNAPGDWRRTCQEWRRLVEAEGEAIRAGHWTLVADCQSVRRRLQPLLHSQIEAARRQETAAGRDTGREDNWRTVILSLIALERHNNALLETRRQRAAEVLAGLEQARLTLRRFRSRYAPTPISGKPLC